MRSLIYRTLRRSESFFKTDMVYITKSGFWLGLAQVVISLTSLGVSIIFARYLTQEAYGTYKYTLSIAAILSSFTLTGFGTSISNAVARGYEGTLRMAFHESLKWSIPMLIGALCLSFYYFYNGNSNLSLVLLIIGIATPITNSTSLYTSYLVGKKEFRTLTTYTGLSTLFTSICIAITAYITHNFLYVAIIYFLSNSLGSTFFYTRTIKRFKPNSNHDPEAHSFGKHLTLINLLNTFSGNADRLLLFHTLGAANLAIYSFAIAIPDQIKGVLGSFSRIAQPKFAEKDLHSIKKHIYPKILKLVMIILLIIVVYTIAAPLIFQYLFPQYMDSRFFSQLIALSLVGVAGTIPLAALHAHAAKKSLHLHAIILNITRLILIIILIPSFGLMGAVLAIIVGRYISLLLPMIILYKTESDLNKPPNN